MDSNDKELEEKKILLKTEILDKNYDQSKFVEFCLSSKPNGDDLTKWSIDELKSTIKEFSSKYPPINTFSQNQQINNIQKDIENIRTMEENIEYKEDENGEVNRFKDANLEKSEVHNNIKDKKKE